MKRSNLEEYRTRLRTSRSANSRGRRWPVIAAGFLLLVLLATDSTGLAQQLIFDNQEANSSTSIELLATTSYVPIISKKPITIPPHNSTGPIFGVNFISSAEDQVDEQQYQNGLSTGATWNRWPLYWFNIETNPNTYNWSRQDTTVQQDLAHGFEIDAILLGTPLFYTTSTIEEVDPGRPEKRGPFVMRAPQAAAPVGLYDPIFTDGTDTPGPGKVINQSNVWARFAYTAVNRYKPGGAMAQAYSWPPGVGITHWEIWNEPDLSWFWDSSTADYARLLKVGYLSVKQADPSASVLVGGLANFQKPTFYVDIMNIFDSDPLAVTHKYFHDILATHSYFNSWESWYHVYRATVTMGEHGVDKDVWLNESGVPAWDDYPGPNWDPTSSWRATMSEQADYLIQNVFFATFAGADAIFHFQLYDGCGNQPAGTDFPPHGGELCGNPSYPICAGDAFGLFRNPTDAVCFTQHPQPETARPYLTAFQLLTANFQGVEPLWRQRPGGTTPYNGPQEWIAFHRPETNERLVAMWSRVEASQTAIIEAYGTSGLILRPDGSSEVVYPSNGEYTLHLPGATNHNDPNPELLAIGGRPLILIESGSN